ncbi:hypothetical protein N8D56_01735 [Devosia sp. A8/3-2]|nr:hypothetical protein N8D56_01735 [Devosia sp. A8/3-2]
MVDELNVAVIVETSNSYARDILRGIHDYARTRRWTLYLTEHGRHEIDESFAGDWKFDGIIARIETESMARIVTAMDVPTVDVSAARLVHDIPWVETDDDAIAQLALEHLRDCGLQNFAFSATPLQLVDLAAARFRTHSRPRRSAWVAHLQPAGPQGTGGAVVDAARSHPRMAR